ncbi:acetyl-CoA synthetase-like protein [Punctularia strigosozonata HHB-11173 SS5]|uniref:acetyl-CoA synthetase-like protein n=1 Tax=Punctularia strigosozonata (strain HHB-11173) TaxID=741275 RepID=UPI0004416A30|nr:acetyl-CoA synthetase-like protein [Punctularia strigosozonata HHB-11173 SS5]EIN13490.1 acetyl-CoA synthetase-like protein [Punctularia strigosozonata HHB-11173 SS5]
MAAFGEAPRLDANPLAFVLKAAQIYPDKLAIAHPDVEQPVFYSYGVWAQRIQNLAYALKHRGIQPGDRVAVIAPNCPLIADAHQATLAARCIITPINTRLTRPEVSYILQHSGARLILIDREYLHLLDGPEGNPLGAQVVVSHDSGRAGDPYEEFLKEGRRASGERGWPGLEVETDEDAGAALCYTSGTTGRPKGVLTTLRGSYLAAIANAFETRMNIDSTYLWILPMFHASGWTYPWAATFAMATQLTIRTVSYPLIWKHFLHSGVTHYCGAPTVQIGIVNDPAARRLREPISAIVAGSAPTAHLIGELTKLHINPVHVYGMTETYGPFTRNYFQPEWAALSLEDRAKFMARQGHQFATALEVRVVYPPAEGSSLDDALVDVPKDGKTVGEIVTRGNITMKEYFRDPEATRKAFRGGCFNSGDLAVMHPDGSIAILDRSKDIIISGGENASSLAIEQELSTHPHVLEVAVVARPHPKWGERAMAFVTLKPDHVKTWLGKHDQFEVELKKHARSRLPGFACPEWVRVVSELPKTSTGKIQKMVLRNKAKL